MGLEKPSTPCVRFSNVFLHPLMDESQSATTQANRREQAMLRSQAEKVCAECPLFEACLTDAVTKYNVSGFVAGTTRRQRQEIRNRLGVQVAEEDLDFYVGVSSGRQFDRNEIYRMRNANPDEPLSAIAARVGCSVSTVKRHLRRVQDEGLVDKSGEGRTPTSGELKRTAAEVKQGIRRNSAAA